MAIPPPTIPKISAKTSKAAVITTSAQEARDDQVLDRVNAHHLEGVELLADLAGAEVGDDRGSADARHHDGRDERSELPDGCDHEQPAEPVEHAEEDEEVPGLEAGGAEPENGRRDHQRKPAVLEQEDALAQELGRVAVRRPERRVDGLRREDEHVAPLLEEIPARRADPSRSVRCH